MPWDPQYRKPDVRGIVANAIDVVVETGDSGPVTPIGINLPNDQNIREKYGFCYNIYSFTNILTDTGDFGVYMGTDGARIERPIARVVVGERAVERIVRLIQ